MGGVLPADAVSCLPARPSQAAWGVRSTHTFKHRLSPMRWPRQQGVFILRVSCTQASGTALHGHSPGLQCTASCIFILFLFLITIKRMIYVSMREIYLFLTLRLFEHCRHILCQENLFSRTTFSPEPASPAWPAQHRPHCLRMVPFFSDGQVSLFLVIR